MQDQITGVHNGAMIVAWYESAIWQHCDATEVSNCDENKHLAGSTDGLTLLHRYAKHLARSFVVYLV